MPSNASAIYEKVAVLFPNSEEMWHSFDDASAISARPFWTASPEAAVGYAKVLPEVFDKERIMQMSAMASAGICNLELEILIEMLKGKDASDGLIKAKKTFIDRLQKHRTELERFNKHAKLHFSKDSGRIKRKFDGYKAPGSLMSMLADLRATGLLQEKQFGVLFPFCRNPQEYWRFSKSFWTERRERFGPIEEWDPVSRQYAYRAVLRAWVHQQEVRKHLAELIIVSAEIEARSNDEEMKRVSALLQEPKVYRPSNAENAKEWINIYENEIAELRKLFG